MPAFYSWLKSNNQQTKQHISHGGQTLCGHDIPLRHTYNIFTSCDVCERCQKSYVKELKLHYGEEWKDYADSSMVPDEAI